MNTLIIEDEQLAVDRLSRIIHKNFDEISILESIDTVRDSVSYLADNSAEIDLIFCDIHLADGSSFEIFDQVDIDTPVIFTTAYDQYSIDAFKVNSIQYLLKPIKENEVVEAVGKYEKYHTITPKIKLDELRKILVNPKETEPRRFLVKSGLKLIPKKPDEIALFYVDNKIVYAFDANEGKSYMTDFTLEELEQKHLDDAQFFRVNRKQIINCDTITAMKPYPGQRLILDLSVRSTFDIIVSREKVTQFKKWFTE